MPTVTATEYQQNVGLYSDIAMREPVIITKQKREKLVLLSVEDYNRLKALDTRQALYAHELSEDLLGGDFKGEATPDLDHLMD
ncbi:MAG: type II toxin-antitoxin system Phd/YefM family antitoxin [OCS116 cluster bacterium]|nr:type II toxin-antitoxin system Phd/YefM family antitoxin [OCS116 cluster bacterium]